MDASPHASVIFVLYYFLSFSFRFKEYFFSFSFVLDSESYLSLLNSNTHDRSPGSHYQMHFKFILRNTRR